MDSSNTIRSVFRKCTPQHIKDIIKGKKPEFYINGSQAALSDKLEDYATDLAMIEIRLDQKTIWFTHIEVEL